MARPYDPWQNLKTKNGLNADEVISGIQKSIRRGEIKDYVLDMHTRRGQAKGRDEDYFYKVASKVIPEKPGAHDEYLPRLMKLMGK